MCQKQIIQKTHSPKVNQRKIENTNKLVTINENETWIKYLTTNKNPGPDGLTDKFYHTQREELTPNFLKQFQKISEGETLPNSFHEATITVSKPDEDVIEKRKLETNIAYEHRCKNPQQNTSKQKSVQSVQSLIHVPVFMTPWTAA